MARIKLELLYRDASNNKTRWDHEVDTNKFPDALKLKAESEFTMGMYGTPIEEDFFDSEIHPYQKGDDDHNLLEVEKVTKVSGRKKDLLASEPN